MIQDGGGKQMEKEITPGTLAVRAKEEFGFEEAGSLNMEALVFRPEVREMCEADRCKSYGKCWSCPPGCGTLEEISERAKAYPGGILVQSVAQLEDEFDIETMMEIEKLHKKRFARFVEEVRDMQPDCLPMSAGACSVCEICTCPDAPCRFPDQAIPSMEAYGLFVSDVCARSGMKYNYGTCTICYTSCILLR
jgi:predicted metal-binding protein